MVRFTGGLLLFTALALSAPAEHEKATAHTQQVLASEPEQRLQQNGNPRKLRGKFLHITDVHPDPFYKVGADPDGDHPCHKGGGEGVSGYFGAPVTDCDSPFTLVNATFQWIEENIKDEIDFVIWTGDSARHDNDEDFPRTHKQVANLNRMVVDKFIEVFGKPGDVNDPDPLNDFVVPIVPTFGNNDILPHNIFEPGPNEWTKEYTEIWSKFIPGEQVHSFARGGWFWTEVIPNKLAVISLNTLYFFENNAAVDGCDLKSEPGYEHFEWLRVQLDFMRKRHMKAYLIGHVPPARTASKQSWDESCYQKYTLWLRQFRDVVAGSFFGHMNLDHFMFQDVKDLTYDFKIDGIDEEDLRPGFHEPVQVSDNDFSIEAKADYLSELREAWDNLPTPPKGATYGSMGDYNPSTKKGKKRKDKFLKEIGGPYAERFSMSFVSPSVIPNFFPTLRIIEYNITGLKHDHPAVISSDGPLTAFHDMMLQQEIVQDEDEDIFDSTGLDTEKKKKKKKKKPQKPNFRVPSPPSKSSPPGPAYSPQTFTLSSWVQLYANLTKIQERIRNDKQELHDGEAINRTAIYKEYFHYKTEYTTNHDNVYKLPEFTVREWLGLAERIGRVKYTKSNDDVMVGQTPPDEVTQDLRPESDVETDMKMKKHKKKKGKGHKSHGKLKDNHLWREFVRRAFVHAKNDTDLEDDFG